MKSIKSTTKDKTTNTMEFYINHYYLMRISKEDEEMVENFYSGYYKNFENIEPMLLSMCHTTLLLLLGEIEFKNIDFKIFKLSEGTKINVGTALNGNDFVLLIDNDTEITILVFEEQANQINKILNQFKNGKLTQQIQKHIDNAFYISEY